MESRSLYRAVYLLPLLFLALPLHLLASVSRLIQGSGGRRVSVAAFVIASIAVLLLVLRPLSGTDNIGSNNGFRLEREELHSKLTQLENIFEDNIKMSNTKSLLINEKDRLIKGMETKILRLQDFLDSIQRQPGDLSCLHQTNKNMEAKVQLLWTELRKINFDLHVLETKAEDSEKKLKSLTSQIRKIEAVITEQWIQIGQLEQAIQITKVRTSRASWEAKSNDYIFLLENLSLKSYISKAFHYIKRFMSSIQGYHHELEHFLKEKMERHQSTAALANEEVIFFLASCIIIVPIVVGFHLVRGSD